MRQLAPPWSYPVALIGMGFSLFTLWTIWSGVYPPFVQRGVHLAFLMPLAFLLFPAGENSPRHRPSALDWALAAAAAAPSVFVALERTRLEERIEFVTPVLPAEMVLAILGLALLLEALRRAVTPVLAGLVFLSVLYLVAGPRLPWIFWHKGASFEELVEMVFLLTGQGMYGSLIGISATYIALFVIFGSFVVRTGCGEFFTDLARAYAGSLRGGPAQIACISSAMFGTISGSAVANVYATGSFTIPMMIRRGYRPQFAGAVEAAASTGGQFMPPIMGAAAFILAETIGMSYGEVALRSALGAILYYVAIFAMIHFEAVKTGLAGEDPAHLPSRLGVLRDAHLFIPVGGLFLMLGLGWSALFAGLTSIGLSAAVSLFRRRTFLTPAKLADALAEGGKNTVSVAVALAGASMIVMVATHTGLALSFAGMVLRASGGTLFVALVLVAITVLILGMGLPTVPSYVIGSTLGAGALTQLGASEFSAHLFTFYFSLISNVTPPVAVAAYAGAGLAGADPIRTGFEASRLALAGYLIPFLFVYNPPLLLEGNAVRVLWAALTALLGVALLGAALQGWVRGRLRPLGRLILLAAALSTIEAGLWTDLLGFALLGLFLLFRRHLEEAAPGAAVERLAAGEAGR